MALEFSTIGAKVYVAIEALGSAGKQPSASEFHELPNVSEAPEINLDTEALDCSDITDKITRYVMGRQDPGGTAEFTLNNTNAVIGAWSNLVKTIEQARLAGCECWFAYYFPESDYGFYFTGIPSQLGTSGISQNEVATLSANVIMTSIQGWLAALDEDSIGATMTDSTWSPDKWKSST